MSAVVAVGTALDQPALATQLCGDAHLSNFGLFASPERRLVFDLNDFDETLPGSFEWDVKRLVTSLAVAGRENEFRTREHRRIVLAAAARYPAANTRAHARSGDAAAIAGYLGRSDAFGRALAEFAEAYADHNEDDYAQLVDAARAGWVAVATEP